MIETFMFIAAAAAAAPAASQPAGREQAPSVTVSETRPAPCDILENTFNALVAVEESPGLREIVRPAIFTGTGKQRAIVAPPGAAWIS